MHLGTLFFGELRRKKEFIRYPVDCMDEPVKTGTMGSLKMDEVERGFEVLVERLKSVEERRMELTKEFLEREAELLERMIGDIRPLVPKIGMILLMKGKQDTRGEIYEPVYYRERMLVLGKTNPAEFRPDDVTKKVENQFLVLHEDGTLYELMYSSDGFKVDSYLNPLSPKDAIGIYGHEISFNLFRYMREHLGKAEELLHALETVLMYIEGAAAGGSGEG